METISWHADSSLGLTIGFAISGIGQFCSQFMGMYALYKPERDVKQHMNHMHAMLLLGCLGPAVMRLPAMLGPSFEAYVGDAWPALVMCIPVLMLSKRARKANRWY